MTRPLTPAESKQIEEWLPVAQHTARRLCRLTKTPFEEILSIAYTALVESLPLYEPELSGLEGFLFARVFNRTLDVLRKTTNTNRRELRLRAAALSIALDAPDLEAAMNETAPHERARVIGELEAQVVASLISNIELGGSEAVPDKIQHERAREHLWLFAAELPEPHRTYFYSFYRKELSAAAIGVAHRVSTRTVERSLVDSRDALFKRFEYEGII